MELRIGSVGDVRRDGCRVVDVGGRPVGVISVGNEFFAIHDRCPRMGTSMCTGPLAGTFLPAAPHELGCGMHDR